MRWFTGADISASYLLDASFVASDIAFATHVLELSDESVPLKRPHYELRQGHLFFLISTRPYAQLDDVDEELWRRIDGIASVGQLRELVPDVGRRIARFWELAVCEVAQPQQLSAGGLGRRRVLVVEPHMDDAVLSVGGVMWARRGECEFTVVTIAGQSNFTSYYYLDRDYFNVERVSALRAAESRLAMRLLGGRHQTLNELEAPLRFQPGNWTLEWYRHHRKLVDAFIGHRASEGEVESWALRLVQLLRDTQAAEIWLPLGVGSHTDHELTRDAWLRALTRLPHFAPRTSLYFYQDVPYATQFPDHTSAIVRALTAAGAVLETRPDDIGASLEAKLRLVSIFASQFKPSYMAALIDKSARQASPSGKGHYELRFKVERLPDMINGLALYSRYMAIERLAPKVRSWYRRHRSAPVIRILSPVPVARWAEDLSFLLQAFPRAVLEIHVSEEYLAETWRLTSSRVHVRAIHGREGGWIAHLLRVGISRPRPTVVLTGEGLMALAPLARVGLVLSDPLVATRLNDLVLALRVITDTDQKQYRLTAYTD